jgi:hypothetical protein
MKSPDESEDRKVMLEAGTRITCASINAKVSPLKLQLIVPVSPTQDHACDLNLTWNTVPTWREHGWDWVIKEIDERPLEKLGTAAWLTADTGPFATRYHACEALASRAGTTTTVTRPEEGHLVTTFSTVLEESATWRMLPKIWDDALPGTSAMRSRSLTRGD